MKRTVVPIVSALAVLGAFSVAVVAQEMKPDRAIKYRQGIMQAIGWHTGVLGAMAKGEQPYNKDTAARSAKFISELSAMPWDGFIPVSDTGAPTKAKPEIWKEKPKFDKLAQEMQVETQKLAAVAGNGLDALKGQLGPTGKSCSNCHEDFRAK